MEKKTAAIIYDFDETLTPKSSLDYTLFPYLQINSEKFWKIIESEIRKNNGDWLITFMRVLAEDAEKKGKPLTKNVFKKLSGKVKYCPGVKEYFKRINSYFYKNKKDMELRHYIVSGNLKEIIENSVVAKNFYNIYASGYYYKKGKAVFPNLIINDTMKTQCVFRINKGKEKFIQDINGFVPDNKRPVIFKNIIYIGDGFTDVPAMTVVKENGGCSIAVYNNKNKKKICKRFIKEGRADYAVFADYRAGSALDKIVKIKLRDMQK